MGYQMTQWLDTTSHESLAQEHARILYGVREHREGRWGHLHENGEPCLFEDRDEAGMFIDFLIYADQDARQQSRGGG